MTENASQYGDTHEERARELLETGTSVRRTGQPVFTALIGMMRDEDHRQALRENEERLQAEEGSTYTVRIYGYDEQAQGEALLSEHDFTSEAEARQAEHDAIASGAGVVTFNAQDTTLADEWTANGEPLPETCILTGEDGENPDDCTTHEHEH